jgi:hypothetical protein
LIPVSSRSKNGRILGRLKMKYKHSTLKSDKWVTNTEKEKSKYRTNMSK